MRYVTDAHEVVDKVFTSLGIKATQHPTSELGIFLTSRPTEIYNKIYNVLVVSTGPPLSGPPSSYPYRQEGTMFSVYSKVPFHIYDMSSLHTILHDLYITPTVLIKEMVKLPPKLFTSDIFQNIESILKSDSYINSRHGYILNILSINEVTSVPINMKGDLQFSVVVRATTFKPLIGNVYNGMVCICCDNGVFLSVKFHNIEFNVLISITGYDSKLKRVRFPCGCSVGKDEHITVLVTSVRLDKTNDKMYYNVVGKKVCCGI